PAPRAFGLGTGACAGDLDGDGDVDLIVVGYDSTPAPEPTLVLWNNGAGSNFARDRQLSGPLAGKRAHACALGDISRDGDLDLFIAAEGRDVLFLNDGTGQFVDATDAASVGGSDDDVSSGALFADFNRDGLLDLYVANQAAEGPPYPAAQATNRLYLNL